MSKTTETAAPTKAIARIDGSQPAGDPKIFSDFLKSRMPAIRAVAARHLNPDRLFRIVIANVTRTPALKKCTMDSIFRSVLQAAELGLEPGSAIGEAYLVPYGNQCTLIPGYRGLISLAFRSGHVKSVTANVVWQGDRFEYEMGLEPKLRHVPAPEGSREPNLITWAYCVVMLKDGGVIYDVMTRSEIEAIRRRSKAANNGPWVTDFAEMCRKTVCRRTLKYAPMSVEMSKALAADLAAEAGEGVMDAEFEALEMEDEPEQATRTETIREKVGPVPEGQAEGYAGPTVSDETDGQGALV